MITVEELFKKYSSTYHNKDIVFSYLLYQLSKIAHKSAKPNDNFGISTLMPKLINSKVLFSGVRSYLTKRIKKEIKDSYYSETLILLAKTHALDQKRLNEKREPSCVLISKDVSLIYRCCHEDEGDEFILEEDTKFFNIDQHLQKRQRKGRRLLL